jgi:hypothetical protein
LSKIDSYRVVVPALWFRQEILLTVLKLQFLAVFDTTQTLVPWSFSTASVFKQVGLGGELNVDVYSATGDGSTLTFSIGNTTAISANDQVIVFVGSIYQAPTTAYAITGGGYDITFTSAPPSGEPINIIRNLVAPATP